MLSEDEETHIDMLLECFGWDSTEEARFHALLILRRARGEAVPLWDDYKARTK